jgi:hypothetical protein
MEPLNHEIHVHKVFSRIIKSNNCIPLTKKKNKKIDHEFHCQIQTVFGRLNNKYVNISNQEATSFYSKIMDKQPTLIMPIHDFYPNRQP